MTERQATGFSLAHIKSARKSGLWWFIRKRRLPGSKRMKRHLSLDPRSSGAAHKRCYLPTQEPTSSSSRTSRRVLMIRAWARGSRFEENSRDVMAMTGPHGRAGRGRKRRAWQTEEGCGHCTACFGGGGAITNKEIFGRRPLSVMAVGDGTGQRLHLEV
jgi:hypothetical protein